MVTGPVDERVPRLAVGGDRCQPNGTMFVAHIVRVLQDGGPLAARVRHAPVDVRHLQRDVDDAVAVPPVVIGDRAARAHRALEHEPDGPAAQHVRVMVPVAGLRAGVGDQLHAEGQLEEQRGLGGVADRPHHGVPPGDGERIGVRVVGDQAHELPELIHVEVSELFLAGQGLVDAHALASFAAVLLRPVPRRRWRGTGRGAIRTRADPAAQVSVPALHMLVNLTGSGAQ